MNVTRGRNPGQWWPLDCTPHWNTEPIGPKKPVYSAELYCPTCGKPTTMVNHNISPEGVVTPSFVECADKERCGKTHEFLILDGWPEFKRSVQSS